MDIDIATGLPVMPEGYHWRVVDHKEDLGFQNGELEVQLIREFTTKVKQHVWKEDARSWRNLWLGRMQRELEEFEVEEEEIFLREGLIQYRDVPKGVLQQYLENGWSRSRRKTMKNRIYEEDSDTIDRIEIFHLLEPTEGNIVDAASVIFGKFVTLQVQEQADKEDSLARQKLVGDYPPKTLSAGGL